MLVLVNLEFKTMESFIYDDLTLSKLKTISTEEK